MGLPNAVLLCIFILANCYSCDNGFLNARFFAYLDKTLQYLLHKNRTVEELNVWMETVSRVLNLYESQAKNLSEYFKSHLCLKYLIHSVITESLLPALRSILKAFRLNIQRRIDDNKIDAPLTSDLTILEEVFSVFNGTAYKNLVQENGEPHQTMGYGLAEKGHLQNINISEYCRKKHNLPSLMIRNFGVVILFNYQSKNLRKVVYTVHYLRWVS